MQSYHALSEEKLAEYYLSSKGDLTLLPDTATGLVNDVQRWLKVSNLQHRLDSSAAIASEAYSQARKQAPVQSQAEEAAQYNREQGWGNDRPDLQMDELALKQRVQGMSMADYSANRERLNVTRTVADFSGGN